MTKKSVQLLAVAPLMLAAFFALNAFTKAPAKDIVTGGGYTSDNIYFNFNVVENKGSTTGHFSWDGVTYEVECVAIQGKQATIYLDNGQAVYIVDGGSGSNADPDQISAPFTPLVFDCDAFETHTTSNVTGGNLTVHK
jgi:hypothetical protein